MEIKEFYLKHYKKLFLIPVLLVAIALAILINQYAKTGDIINKDVSLSGGITATVYTEKAVDVIELEKILNNKLEDTTARKLSEFGSDKQIGIVIETSDTREDILKKELESYIGIKLEDENYSVEEMGSSLGESFYKQMAVAILAAFILMAIVVFVTFRSFVPSLNVVFAAFADIVITLAVLDLFNIKIGTAGVAALLLLIGYSVDTDILLTTRVLKRKEGDIFERTVGAVKTGLTMTFTTIVALTVGYFVSSSFILKEIFLIILIGLVIDIISTYLMNAGVLFWYAGKKEAGVING